VALHPRYGDDHHSLVQEMRDSGELVDLFNRALTLPV
jgi:hypothetical protein